jgi:hypothetical protein
MMTTIEDRHEVECDGCTRREPLLPGQILPGTFTRPWRTIVVASLFEVLPKSMDICPECYASFWEGGR